MRQNSTKARWRHDEVTHGAWLMIPDSFSAEVVAHQGFDWVCIDMQHGVIDYLAAVRMLQAISTTEATPFVRVPWNDFAMINKVLDAGADYFEHANDEIACVPMIETKQALASLDAILDVPGIDAVYVGPADMSITLGQPPRMDNGGDFEAARLAIADACKRHGVVAGIHANASLAAKHAAAGYRMITITTDAAALTAAAAADLRSARGALRAEHSPDAV